MTRRLVILEFVPALLAFLMAGSGYAAQTYYVRTDGGTATQCTGLADAPFPGSGTGRACAWAHPYWAVNSEGRWRLAGGDTLIIAPGSYMMGWGAPNTSEWCDAPGAFGCTLPPIPSGTKTNPTRILGSEWSTGCGKKPELWGTERLEQILSLVRSSDVVIECLEITDHSGCGYAHCNQAVACKRESPPYGPYADIGIRAEESSRVTLRNLDIHGFADSGITAAGLTDWTVENVRLAGNSGAGWNGDVGENSSCSGKMIMRRLLVEWNGCPETYPGKEPANCWGQNHCGGYGDGLGFGRTGGSWTIEESIFRYNVSDGLDLLYAGVDHPDATVDVLRSQAYGNAGNQIKLGARSRVINSLAVSNCAFFYGKPFGAGLGNMDEGDHCRAGGSAVALFLSRGGTAAIANSTIASQGWALTEFFCITKDFADQPSCNGTERVTMVNNVLQGYQVVYLPYDRLSDLAGDGDPEHFTIADSIDYNTIYNADISLPIGSKNLIANPLVQNDALDSFDGRLRPSSPAIDSGLAVGALGGLIPAIDLPGVVRPQGKGVDHGAYEYQSGGTSCTLDCSSTVPSSAQLGSSVTFSATASASGCASAPVFDWDYGDGAEHGTGSPASHLYAVPGSYSWRLSVSAGTAGVTCTKTGTIAITGTSPNVSVIPSVTHTPGASSSLWRTNVAGINRAGTPANVTMTFVPASGTLKTRTLTIPANGTSEWPDILTSVFEYNAADKISGALHASSDRPLLFTSRTYNEVTDGTLGAYLGAVSASAALVPGPPGVLPQLKKNSRFRSNVGVTNLGSAAVTVAIRLYGSGGTLLGHEVPVENIPAGGLVQVSDVFAAAGAGESDLAYATVEVKTEGGRVAVFASVTDNDTNDPTIIPLSPPLASTLPAAGAPEDYLVYYSFNNRLSNGQSVRERVARERRETAPSPRLTATISPLTPSHAGRGKIFPGNRLIAEALPRSQGRPARAE